VTDLKENLSGLPKGWVRARIGDIFDLINGRAFKPSEWASSGLPIIRIQNLNDPIAEFNYCTFYVDEKYIVESGQLLFAWSGTPGTSFGAHIWNRGKAVLNQHIFKVNISQNYLDKTFLKLLLNNNVKEYIGKAHGTAGLAHITKGKFEAAQILLPPINEQRRISQKVEELFSFLDAGVASLYAVQAQLKRYRQAVLKAALRGDLTKDWRDIHSRNLLSKEEYAKAIEKETSNSKYNQLIKKTERYFQKPPSAGELPESWLYIPLIKVATLHRGFDLPKDMRKDGHYPVVASSSIVGYHNEAQIRGPGVVTGRSGTIGEVRFIESDFWPLNTTLFVCDFHGNDPKFVSILLQAMQIKKFLSGTGVPTLNRNIVHPVQVPLPQLQEQKEIVAKVEELFSIAEKTDSSIHIINQQIDRLSQSILRNAFWGKLVSQNPTDEPADRLLERIKAEQLTNKSKNKNQVEL
jgi:type I restriction enzyme, S subunit